MKRQRNYNKIRRWVICYDLHYPKHDEPTWRAIKDFIVRNRVDGFVLAGDNFNNEQVSHHTRGKAMLRSRGGYLNEIREFDRDILKPVEKLLPRGATKVWLDGNHEAWSDQLIEEQPELDGLQHRYQLRLKERDWKVVRQGRIHKIGKLSVIHGDIISGGSANAARKAVELFVSNVVLGHFHSPSSCSRISPRKPSQKWMAWVSPIAGDCDADYLKGKATGWMNGCVIVESWSSYFNLYPVIIVNGTFAYGGKLYGRKPNGKNNATHGKDRICKTARKRRKRNISTQRTR